MRLVLTTLAGLALLGVAGLSTAAPGGEETLTLDLSAIPDGPTLFVKCSTPGKDLRNCGFLSIWQQANIAPQLQSTVFSFGGKPHEPDAKLLG